MSLLFVQLRLAAMCVVATSQLVAQVPRPAQSTAPRPAQSAPPRPAVSTTPRPANSSPQASPKQPPAAAPAKVSARETPLSFGLGLPQLAPPLANLPTPVLEKLANGAGVLVVPDSTLPLVDISVMVRAGYSHDPVGKRGLTRAVSQGLRFGGTLDKSEKEIEAFLSSRALALQVVVGPELTQWAVRCRKDDVSATLALLAEMLTRPAFRRAALEGYVQQMRQAIQSRGQNLEDAAALEIEAAWFGPDSPWTRRYTYADARAIDRESIVAQYEKTVTPARTTIGLSGDIDAPTARQLLATSFGAWTAAPGDPDAAPSWPVPKRQLIALDKPNSPSARLIVAVPFGKRGPQRDAAETAALSLLAAQLDFAHGAGLGTIMERYESNEGQPRVASGLGIAEIPVLRLSVPLRPREAIDGTVALWKELQALGSGKITPANLDAAKRTVLQMAVYQTATSASRFQLLMEATALGASPGYLAAMQQAVVQMTAAEYERLVKQHFNLDAAQLVLIGDERDYRSAAETAGFPVVRATTETPAETPAAPADESASREKALRVLAEAQQAMGGAALLAGIRDATWNYEARLIRAATPIVVSQHNSWLQPGFYRQEQTSAISSGVSYYDGKVGWSHNGRNLLSLTPQLALQYRNEVIRLLFRIVRAGELDGYKVAYLGSGAVKITSPENYQVELAVDFQTKLPERLRFAELRPTDNATITVEEQLSNYKSVGGVLMPHRILVKQLGQEFADFTMTEMRLNTGLTEEQMSRKP